MREGTALDQERELALERHSVVDHYFTEDAKEGFRAFDEDRSSGSDTAGSTSLPSA